MQRVSSVPSYLRSTFPTTIRRNSTQAPPTPEPVAPKKPAKLTLKGWDDIILPSREEVLAKKKEAEKKTKAPGLYQSKTDLHYLQSRTNKSFAAQLAKSMLKRQEKMLTEEEKPEQAPAQGANLKEQRQSDSAKISELAEASAEKRRAARLSRQADSKRLEAEATVKKELAERKEVVGRKEMAGRKGTAGRKEIAGKKEMAGSKELAKRKEETPVQTPITARLTTEQRLKDINLVASSLMTANLSRRLNDPVSLSEGMKLAKESAAKRRSERIARQAQAPANRNRVQRPHTGDRAPSKKAPVKRGVNLRTKKQPEEVVFEEPSTWDGVAAYLPEFTGPPAYSLDLTPIRQPKLVASTKQYVPESLSFTTKRVDNFYPPSQLVQMVLSHRGDVSIAKRNHALALVKSMTKSSSLSKVEA